MSLIRTMEIAESLSPTPDSRWLVASSALAGAGKDNPIEALARSIQSLPPKIRWLHVQPDVITARASAAPLSPGPRTRAVELLLNLTRPTAFARPLVYLASLVLLVATYLKQLRHRPTRELSASIFVGIRALRETALLHDFKEERGEPVSYLDERGLDDFARILRLRFGDLLTTWWGVVRDSSKQLGGEAPAIGLATRERQIAFLTSAHRYAYFLTWFSRVGRVLRIEEPVVFSAASPVSFAAVASGLRTEYRLHGFQRQSLVYPDFMSVRCFTLPETAHFRQRLPHARVVLKSELSAPIATERVVAVAGCYGQTVGYDDCVSFIAWAKKERIRIIVRPHPLDRSGFYEQWRSDPDVEFSDTGVAFDQFLEQQRPRMVLSWYSTALFDALRRGVVPVTVETEAWRSLDMVFPFREISLRWRQDRRLADELMSCDEERARFLGQKRKLAGIEEFVPTS